MRTINIQIPERLNEQNTLRFIAAKLFEDGRVTLAQAAAIANMKTRDFAEILSEYEVSIFNYPASDIADDAANA